MLFGCTVHSRKPINTQFEGSLWALPPLRNGVRILLQRISLECYGISSQVTQLNTALFRLESETKLKTL
jgi:hypothetical protein